MMNRGRWSDVISCTALQEAWRAISGKVERFASRCVWAVKDDVVGELVGYGVTTVVGNLGGEPCWVVSVKVS